MQYQYNRLSQPIIRFENVAKTFGHKQTINSVSFDIYQGEIFGLMGQSGAGKTTLLRLLIGFYKPSSGRILYNNQDIYKHPKLVSRVFGFGTQDNCFYHELTIMENLRYFGRLYKMKKKEIEDQAIRVLNLIELFYARDVVAKDLSGGMQRRLDLACALMHKPLILVLDEPTTGLDPLLRKHIWNLILRINRMGITIIISTHLLDEIETLCSRVAMIKNGNLIISGTPAALKNLYSKNEEIHLETYPGRYSLIIQKLKEMKIPISYIRYEGHKVVLYVPYAEKTLHSIIHILEDIKEVLLDVDVNKPSLNEIFEAFAIR